MTKAFSSLTIVFLSFNLIAQEINESKWRLASIGTIVQVSNEVYLQEINTSFYNEHISTYSDNSLNLISEYTSSFSYAVPLGFGIQTSWKKGLKNQIRATIDVQRYSDYVSQRESRYTLNNDTIFRNSFSVEDNYNMLRGQADFKMTIKSSLLGFLDFYTGGGVDINYSLTHNFTDRMIKFESSVYSVDSAYYDVYLEKYVSDNTFLFETKESYTTKAYRRINTGANIFLGAEIKLNRQKKPFLGFYTEYGEKLGVQHIFNKSTDIKRKSSILFGIRYFL